MALPPKPSQRADAYPRPAFDAPVFEPAPEDGIDLRELSAMPSASPAPCLRSQSS